MSVNPITLAARSRAVPLSRRLWGVDWTSVFPRKLDSDVTVESGRFEEALPFIQEHYARIFAAEEAGGRFLASPQTEAKRRFCDESDVFLLRSDAGIVGLLLANPLDWSTYYLRTTAILPDYRGRNLFSRLVDILSAPLRAAGVERFEADVSPENRSTMRLLSVDLGFRVTATSVSERWGALVRLTCFLSEEADTVFHRQFCNYPRSSQLPRGLSAATQLNGNGSNPERRTP